MSDLDYWAECIRKGDDPSAVLAAATTAATKTALDEAASLVHAGLIGHPQETRALACHLLTTEANKH